MAKKFKLEIELDNEAFQHNDGRGEIMHILRQAATELKYSDQLLLGLHDKNGNRVGTCHIEESAPQVAKTTGSIKTSELRLADVVLVFEGAWGSGVVTQIRDGIVTIFRPYGATADFSYTGGVIPYVGFELITYQVDSSRKWLIWERKELR